MTTATRPRSGAVKAAGLWRSVRKNRWLYVMFTPVLLFYIIFKYIPMFGIIIAFKDYNIFKGIWGSPWVGLENFMLFFESHYFFRLIRNTFLISFYGLIFGFPAPILLALALNELRDGWFKKMTQTISYLPHFLSSVIIAGIYTSLLRPETGLINNIRAAFGLERIYFLIQPEYFRSLYTIMGVWAGIGWGSIIYLAALTGIDPELYEACVIDGGGRIRQTVHITIPGILPTVMIMLIFRVGDLLSVGSDSILLLYTPSTYETADVISTYVYRRGLIDADYSFSAAVGLFNSVIAMVLLTISNALSKKFGETSLW
jgi:putative aldouronate transport system permease protein